LFAALDGNRRLGSPMDAVLQVAAPAGFVLEQVDDAPGLDPKLGFKAPADGTYHIRVFAFPSVQNSTIGFAGGDDFIYRLTLTAGPYLERTMPLAIGPEGLGIIDAIGRDIPAEARRLRVESTARGDRARAWHPRLAGDVELPRLAYPCLVEAGVSSRDKPQPLAIPCAISGRISASVEEDVEQFHAKAAQTLRIRVEAQTLGSPLDPVVRVLDATGKVVAEQDDIRSEAWDVDLSFKAPADGAYRLALRDLNRVGGVDFVYLLHIADPAEMLPTSTLAQDRFNVEAGKSVELSIGQQRPRGRGRGRQPAQEEPDRPIAFEVLGLPAGVTAESKEAKGPTRTITLKASPEALTFSGPIIVVARADGREWVIPATIEGLGATIESPWLTIIRR
jgi:hypothetical protein